jgi:hypothetical protein
MSIQNCPDCGFTAVVNNEPCVYCYPRGSGKIRKTRRDKGIPKKRKEVRPNAIGPKKPRASSSSPEEGVSGSAASSSQLSLF